MDFESVLRVEREQDRQQDHADHEGNQDQRKSGYDIILELESAEADDHCVGGHSDRCSVCTGACDDSCYDHGSRVCTEACRK